MNIDTKTNLFPDENKNVNYSSHLKAKKKITKHLSDRALNSKEKTHEKMQNFKNTPVNFYQENLDKLVRTNNLEGNKTPKKIGDIIQKKSFINGLRSNIERVCLEETTDQISDLYISDKRSLIRALEDYSDMGYRSYDHSDFLRFLKLESEALRSNLFPELTPEDGIKCIVRLVNWNNFYNKSDQTLYSHEMVHAIRLGSLYLKENPSLNDLLQFHALRRKSIAYKLNTTDSYKVGYLIKNLPNFDRRKSTRINESSPYSEVFRRLSKKLEEDVDHQSFEKDKYDAINQIVKINGEKLFCNSFDPNLLYHTDQPETSKIMDYVENILFPEALKENDPDKLTEKLGEIFWMICQASPWLLGDPSIAEMLIKSIWLFKTGEIPAWKEGIIPWVEATCEPDVEKFKANLKIY